ncbi:unnamed protein product [Closterium sp. NIES-54]
MGILNKDLVSHVCASDARYRTAVPAEFFDRNPPPIYITLYFIVTRLPDSLCSVRDHFLSLDPTSLTVDLLEQHLLALETSAVAVGAASGTPRQPFFEGCSPSPETWGGQRQEDERACHEGEAGRGDPGIAAASLGASESGTLPGTAPAEALHTFTLDSGASRCFFRDSTTLTPLPASDPVRLADPSGGPVVARSSTVLPCPAGPAPSGVSQVDPLPGPALVQVAIDSGAARGAASGGAEPGGVESEGAETGGSEPGGVETGDAEPGGVATRGAEPRGVATRGAEPEGVEPGGAEPGGVASEGAECGGAEPQGAASSGESAGALPRLSPQQLREWFVRHPSFGVELLALLLELVLLEGAGSGDPTESGDTSAGGSNAGGAGAGGAGVGGPGVGGAGVGGMVL